MASVQELLLAAEARSRSKFSPLSEVVQLAMQGYDQGQQDRVRRLGIEKANLELEQMRQQKQFQEDMRKRIEGQIAAATESKTKQDFAGVGGTPKPVTPHQKLKQTITQDEQGRYGIKFEVAEPKDKTYTKVEYLDESGKSRIGKWDETTGEVLKSPNDAVSPSSASSGKTYYWVDPSTRQMYDQDLQPIAEAPKGAMPKILSNPMGGAETVRREGLVNDARQSIASARTVLTPGVLDEMKGIKFTPGKIYSQLASTEAKQFYRELFNAVSSELYIKTGATANPTEIEGRMIAYFPAANDSLSDMNGRLNMLERVVGNFSTKPLPGGSKKSAEQRFSELIKSGKTEDEAYKTLVEEGY